MAWQVLAGHKWRLRGHYGNEQTRSGADSLDLYVHVFVYLRTLDLQDRVMVLREKKVRKKGDDRSFIT